MVLLNVLTLEQAYRAINWTAVIMVASLLAVSTAMYKSGAAAAIADALVGAVSDANRYVLSAALFLLTATLTQLISSAAAAMIIIPIAAASAHDIGVSPRAALVTVVIGSASSFLTPVASTPNMMVQGPGGYRFDDYWKLGLPLTLWFLLVATFLVPVFWRS
jgi:di/tricarboxylate transporter